MEFSPDRYDAMQYRRCGRSGLMLPAISLGAYETFGSYKGEDVARECLYRAFDLGITHFDLANNYGIPPGNADPPSGLGGDNQLVPGHRLQNPAHPLAKGKAAPNKALGNAYWPAQGLLSL